MNMRNKRGSVLMLVVIFSLIVTLLGFAVIYMNGLEYLAVRRDLMDERALLMAEGGLDVGRAFLYFCDARLEDAADMNEAGGGSVRSAVVAAMATPQAIDKNYRVYGGPLTVDNSFPRAYCEVWISSATNNMAKQGVYDYRITSRGVATYGFDGTADSVKVEHMLITISSVTLAPGDPVPAFAAGWTVCSTNTCSGLGLKHLSGDAAKYGPMAPAANATRYFFKFDRDTERASEELPTTRVIH